MIGTHALLLTDVVDSTTLSEKLGDAAMAALWARHDALARDLLRVHCGKEIDKADGFLLLFDNVTDAVGYAIAYHHAVASLDPPLQARAGIHIAEVILTENALEVIAMGAKPLEVNGLAKPMAARVMSVAMGGQTLLSNAARSSLGPTRLRLASHGHWRMKGIAEPMELFEVGDADAPFMPPPDGAKAYRVVAHGDLWLPVKQVKHSLPTERDAFVGRKADLHALADRLQRGANLVSVLGIGGSGKTRLVTRYGWSWLGDYPGGVWFCDLSEARTVEGIAYAVAQALDVPLGKDDPIVQLGHAIAGRGRCLVLLDNFEQVARHAAETLGRWIDRARDAQFVVTSREVLGLPGEEALALAPMPPSEGAALFAARARSAKRDFEPDDGTSIDALVKLLDGLPLSIELAAARVRVMPPKTLLHRMGERFKLLSSSGGRHTRQATLRATLDWSWDLLSSDEQQALAQLSVFEGGFTLDAAEAVLALADMWSTDAVQSLVDKSLVRPVSHDRFDLLVSVQEYAAEKRRGFEPVDTTEARHGAHFARFGMPEAIESLLVHGGIARRLALARELDNLIAACGRAVTRGDGAVAAALLEAAWSVLYLRGPCAVGVKFAEQVLGLSSLFPQQRASAGYVLGAALHLSGRVDEGQTQLHAALAAARAVGDRRLEGILLSSLGALHDDQGRMPEAEADYDAALIVARERGDRRREGHLLGNLGIVHRYQGRMGQARAHFDSALAIAREVGDRRREGIVTNSIGVLHVEHGRMDEAGEHFAAALEIAREVGDRRLEGHVLGNLGDVCYEQGRMDEARARYDAELTANREVGDPRNEGHALGNIGNLLRLIGDREAAIQHLTRALALCREIGFSYGQPYLLTGLALIDADAGQGNAALALALEAVAIADPFPPVLVASLETLARVHLARGEVSAAREAIARARALLPKRIAMLGAVDALVAVAEGDRVAAEAALAEATADPALCLPGTEVAQIVTRARSRLEAVAVDRDETARMPAPQVIGPTGNTIAV